MVMFKKQARADDLLAMTQFPSVPQYEAKTIHHVNREPFIGMKNQRPCGGGGQTMSQFPLGAAQARAFQVMTLTCGLFKTNLF